MRLFNKKRLIVSGVFSILTIVLIVFLGTDIFTYSRYETQVSSQNTITTAIYILNDEYQTINVKLPDVIPGNNQYKYKFSISNFKNELHADTNLKYRLHIRTTTNVDIKYNLFNTFDIDNAETDIVDSDTLPDVFGTYFNNYYTAYKTMQFNENKTDNYTLLFTFPNDFIQSKYSGIAELIEINVESSQVLATDT